MAIRPFSAIATVGVVLLLAASGCRSDSSPSPGPIAYDLPVIPADFERDPICAGVELTTLVLRGTLDGGVATVTANGKIPILWPRGFSAVFTPELVIRSPDGRDFAHQGEDMHGVVWHGMQVCVLGRPGGAPGDLVIWIAPFK
jgi:hypothetical protein